jgi:hypothetical protein
MMIENSPRATSAAPARTLPGRPTPARRPAIQPVANFVAIPVAAGAAAGSRATGDCPGSVDSPKNTRKTAANRSRSGMSRSRTRSATCPDRAMPTRKAPTAADTCTASAAPDRGDDPGRADRGDSGQGQRGRGATAQQQRQRDPGQPVQQEVRDAHRRLPAQRPDQVGSGVLQSQHEQQQDDADLRPGLEEPGWGLQRYQPADAGGEVGQQVQRDRRQADPSGQATDEPQAEHHGAEFEQQLRGVVHAGPGDQVEVSSRATAATPFPIAEPGQLLDHPRRPSSSASTSLSSPVSSTVAAVVSGSSGS